MHLWLSTYLALEFPVYSAFLFPSTGMVFVSRATTVPGPPKGLDERLRHKPSEASSTEAQRNLEQGVNDSLPHAWPLTERKNLTAPL